MKEMRIIMILSCQNISKAFGEDSLFQQVSFHLEEKEKCALVGVNGAGKSTLFKIIMKELSADEGQVVIANNAKIGYLAQHQTASFSHTIYEEMLEAKKDVIELSERIRELELKMNESNQKDLDQILATYTRLNHQFEQMNGYAYKSEITGVLTGLGFLEEDYNTPISQLSGGQKTRVVLGKLLLQKPDILLLDEPTNHLDVDAIAWLETYLASYPGAVFIISHDRYFLNKIVSSVIELDHGKCRKFTGNYSQYATKRAQIREIEMKQYMNQQREIKHQEEVITKLRSFNREKSIKRAESREKLLNKMDVLDKPIMKDAKMRFSLEPSVLSGEDVLSVKELKKSFAEKDIFSNVSFEIKRGDRVALIGANGTGKTTILKILNKKLHQDEGSFLLGSQVEIGYYDQEHQTLDLDKTIFDEISDAYPELTNTQIRNTLAAFLFTQDDVFAPICTLSGGEKGRVSLAKLMLSHSNFLVLDEPTNHLDIDSKEILEEALKHYTGTLLFVSHDRYFINQVATRVLELSANGVTEYLGNYDSYLEKKAAPVEETLTPSSAPKETSQGKTDWKKSKEEQAKKRKQERELKDIEEKIQFAEERITTLDETMALPENATNTAKLMELNKEKEELEENLTNYYQRWEELMEE